MQNKITIPVRLCVLIFLVQFFLVPVDVAAQTVSENDVSALTYFQEKEILRSSNPSISIDLQEVTLEEALVQIAKKAKAGIYFDSNLLPAKKVNHEFHEIPLNEILHEVLNGTELRVHTSGRNIFLKEKTDTNEIGNALTVAPDFEETITGTVIDAQTEEALPGVNISVKGTTQGTSTDMNGVFELEVPTLQDTLVISYIGYQQQEIPINSRTEIAVEMTQQVVVGDEIVVTAIGTRRLRDNVGSASSDVAAEDILQSKETGLINSLAGQASGVRIGKSNGDPGAGSVIQIRGANTIQGASQPLIIMDGVPISNDNIGSGNYSQQSRLNDINPNDVESVEILKGASAAALWGSRAANGVIVITTKNGSNSESPSVEYSFSQSFDYINVKTPLQNTFGQGRNGEWNPSNGESWGDKIEDRAGGTDVVDESGEYFLSESGEIYYPVITKNSRETFRDSNYDMVFQTGTYSEHDLSVSGGGEKSSYYFSAANLNQEGIIKNYTYDRQNLRLNNRVQLTDWLDLDNKISYTSTNSNRIVQAGNTTNGIMLGFLRMAPDFDMTDYEGTYVSNSGQAFSGRQRSYRRHLGSNENPIYNNPLWTLNEQDSDNNVRRFIITPELQIDPLEWLNIVVRGGLDYYNDSREEFFPIGSASGTRSGGLWEQFDIKNQELNFDVILNVERDLNQDIGMTATLGGNINDRERQSNTNTISPFAVNADLHTDDLNPDQSSSSWNRNILRIRSNRGYAILGFDFYDQLFVNASGTLEAASTIDGSFFYPSFDVAWQFSDLVQSQILSFGKLRAAWGQVGVQPAPYRFFTLATTGFSSFGGSYLVDSERGNPGLKPEIKTEWEIGTDLRFINNRIEFGATYYQNEISDILFAVRTAPSTGYSFNYTNAATIENQGLELDLRANLINRRDLQVSLKSNFNNNNNEVVDISGAETVDIGGTSKAVQGYPMSAFYLPGTLQDDNGNMVLDDNGFPQLDTNSRVIGDPNPDWRGGLGMELNWKGFDFSFLFEHSQGGDFINRTRVVLNGFGVHEDVGNEITLTEDMVNSAGQTFSAGTTVRGNIEDFGAGPVLLDESWYRGIGGGLGFNKVNDLYVEDATWTKLRNVTLGYTFTNVDLFRYVNFNSIRFSVTGRDLFLWTGLNGIDPETNNYGVSNAFGMNYFNNPGTRSVLFNLQLNL